jgi:hypothetical protein
MQVIFLKLMMSCSGGGVRLWRLPVAWDGMGLVRPAGAVSCNQRWVPRVEGVDAGGRRGTSRPGPAAQ